MKYTEEQIDKAVTWWSNVLKNPEFKSRDNSESGILTTSMLIQLAIKNKVSDEDLVTFKNNLRNLMENIHPLGIRLMVDYHPSGHLCQACKNTNIKDRNFPIKTSMIFKENGDVKVCSGDSANWVKI